MNCFPRHTPRTAPEASRLMLVSAEQSMGFVPNLYAHLAEAPAALEAYFGLSAQFQKTSLTEIERQVVLLATSVENGCNFCVAAHSMIALRMARMPTESVDALRAGIDPPDPRLGALARFTRAVVAKGGWVTDAEMAEFFAARFSAQQALEVVLGVAMKTLSNYANHLTRTETNPELSAYAWKRKA
ncbi:MAG: carboxymuconolactone decarboxylase family protein [Proteobacteria bacterium]|nr:carboxymuconolactone decarboxylase family protein [Pseudomonadota bacterium]